MSIFDLLNKKAESLSSNNYWDTEEWGTVQDENANTYDAKELNERIHNEDIDRLRRFS